MPAERVTMRKIKDILRLRWACGLSNRQVAASCGVARSTVTETLSRAIAAGLSWPLPEELDDRQLEARLYPAPPPPTSPPLAAPDWAALHQELTRKGVTLALLWQEYKAQHLDGYQYSRFCDLYGAWRATLWIGACTRSVPDNLRSGVTKACRYEPELNPTYADLARLTTSGRMVSSSAPG